MQHETRRAAREAAARETAVQDAPTAPRERRGNRKRTVGIVVASVAIVLIAAAAWVAFRALTVKGELEAAQRLLSDSSTDMTMQQRVTRMGEHAHNAASAAGDPIWRVAEYIPAAGDNLRAVRVSSEALDVVANEVGVPAFAAMDANGDGSPFTRLLPVLEAATPEVTAVAASVADAASSDFLIGTVRSGIDQVNTVVGSAAPALEVAPLLLGADGAKNYLFAFQNNAEFLALGGSAASQTLVSVDNGQIGIAGQASSADFANGVAVDVPVDQSALDLYSWYLVDHVNTTMSRPDFPTAATLLKAFWERDISPGPVDGVISIDPIALGRVLEATGPITVGDVEITSKNAVSVLLKDVYTWWDPYASKAEARASDAFFASVATAVFDRVAAGDFDLKDMLWAVNESIENGDLMMWMHDPQAASLLEGQRVAGVLPRDNADATTVGVFFRDASASKIDYYMKSDVDLNRTCTDGESTFAVTTNLHLDISQDDADDLPRYVQSAVWKSEQFRTEVFVYGPPGTTFSGFTADGRDIVPLRTDITDLGRPVAAFQLTQHPGESGAVTATFAGAGDFAPLELRSTPMVHPVKVTIDDGCS